MNKPPNIPALTTEQMIEVDRLMIDKFGISLLQMMENAGVHLAELTRQLLGGSVAGRTVCVLCGRGNNGGGGMVAARHLHNWGAEVHVMRLAGDLKEVPAHQWRILNIIGIRKEPDFNLNQADILLDALIGYGLSGNPRPAAARLIEKINSSDVRVLSLDAPSGLDTNSGSPGKPTVKAQATLSLALPKVGLMTSEARPFVGELYLADISVPRELYRHLGLKVDPLFSEDAIIKIVERENNEHK